MERARVVLYAAGAVALGAVALSAPWREGLSTRLAGGGSPRERLREEVRRLEVGPGREVVSARPGSYFSLAPLSQATWDWLAGGIPPSFWEERRADPVRITASPATGEVDVSLLAPHGVLPALWGTLGALDRAGRATRVAFRLMDTPDAVVIILHATRWSADQEVEEARGRAKVIPAGRFQVVEAHVLPARRARDVMVALAVLDALFRWGHAPVPDPGVLEDALRALQDRVLGDWVEMDRLVERVSAWLAVVLALVACWRAWRLVRAARAAVEPFTGLVPRARTAWPGLLVRGQRGRDRLLAGLEARAEEALARSHRREAARRFEQWRRARMEERRVKAQALAHVSAPLEPSLEEVRGRACRLREEVESDALVPGPVRVLVLDQVAQALAERRPRRAERFVSYAEEQYRAAKGRG